MVKYRNLVEKLVQRRQTFRVASGSMVPTLKVGQRVRILSSKKPIMGDVVAFYWGDKITAHRFFLCIPWKSKRWCITKGDASSHFDHPWPAESLLGVVQVQVTKLERFKAFITLLLAIPRGVFKFLNGRLFRAV